MLLSKLVPGLASFEEKEDTFFLEALAMYHAVLPPYTCVTAPGELMSWRNMWVETQEEQRQATFIEALQRCQRSWFPLIWSLLRIEAIQPVTTAGVERSFSALKRIKTWLRYRTGKSRLNALAMMAITQRTSRPRRISHSTSSSRKGDAFAEVKEVA